MSRMEDLSGSIFSGSIPVSQSTHAFSYNQSGNQVYISGQKTHSEETISKNGIQKNIHVVVKNSPFHITLSTTNRSLDLSRVAFDASLLYEEGGKEVDYVKAKPVELKTTPSEDGRDIDCEFRIKVLTSHHEDLLFKIKLAGHHPISREAVGIEIFTFPIKVISKPEQLKKRPPSKKRTLTDMLVETIARIEKKQEEQQNLIERVLTQQLSSNTVAQTPTLSTPQFSFDTEQSSKRLKHDLFWERMTDSEKDKDQKEKEKEKEKEKAKQSPDFENAFVTMLRAYNSMSPEEKPETIRKMIRSSSTRETERLSELLDLFWTEGLSKERSFGQSSNTNSHSIHGSTLEGCSCTECPHKVELERIDDFYKEFLQTSASMNTQTTF